MKKVVILIVCVFLGLSSYSQANFEWDVIIDSLDDTKEQLYSKTKLFIGETWKSAQKVIQNDDKEAGVILVKGINVQNMLYAMYNHKWTYAYTIKFLMKDKKCRIIITNVYCESASCAGSSWPLMPVGNIYPSSKGLRTTGVNQSRYNTLMSSLRTELQSVVDAYRNYVTQTLEIDSDW